MSLDDLPSRLRHVRQRIQIACERAGRQPNDVTLVGVSKGHPARCIQELASRGLTDIGESYVQEWQHKRVTLPGDLRWHFIGRLQSNKARHVVSKVALIHAVDRPSLVQALERHADAPQDVLLQVNIAGESSKSGCAIEDVQALLDRVSGSSTLRPVGLMTLPPAVENPEHARPHFRALRELRDRLRDRIAATDDWAAARFSHLSMGMSHDMAVAIEEGATIVRIGTALFGNRPTE
ncbi:MAG: YggS family pyridoxal phosphate-dependent enzyme [Deltaproteobacteria bacterium]|nr:MAG: YggS family pyridoxal phosphate-dependent enzyme [Deltaproteobacteria bacterium]